MSMNPIFRIVVAALLLTGSAAGLMAAPVNDTPATTPPAVTETAPAATELTEAEAIAIALEHAKLTVAEVTGLRARRDSDDGIVHYDVEFFCGNWEYDYEIHAVTGKILEWDKEYDPPKQTSTESTEPSAQETTRLTKEEALAIALKHAGLTAEQVKKVECELDTDDGVPRWEIEFRSGSYEYDYEIHAETGKILEWEKDRDD